MATREEVYAKFGIASEAAQLFETELGTLILCELGHRNRWFASPDPAKASAALESISRHTLGRLVASLKQYVELTEDVLDRLSSAVDARNRLNHGFFERHNFKIQTIEGRAEMLLDLENLHEELFNAWQLASGMTDSAMRRLKETRD